MQELAHYEAMAALFEYPGRDYPARVRRVRGLLENRYPRAGGGRGRGGRVLHNPPGGVAGRGAGVADGLVRVTVWVEGSEERLKVLRDEVASRPCVSYCRIYAPTRRVDLGLRLREDWEKDLPDLCRCLCEARAGSGSKTRSLEADGSTRVAVTGDVHNRSGEH
jgi:hypothetical protein